RAYNLPARHVIHTGGPVWRGGTAGEAALLASAYRTSLELAREHGLKTIAFPAISTGVYGYPAEPAAEIAVASVVEAVDTHPGAFRRIEFCCFSDASAAQHRLALAALKYHAGN
ncbi:MAG TPA: macro domain-containing protein, partial [Afifellaceae bacterium]|nr:macro domain-containing protein [Afifellaceae bacterium]